MASAGVFVALLIAALLSASAAKRDLQFSATLTFAAFAALCAAFSVTLGPSVAVVAGVCFVCALVVETDRRHALIPDLLVLALLALALASPFGDAAITQALGAFLLGGAFLLIRQAGNAWRGVETLGWGDVKLAAAMGAVLGPAHGFAAVAIAGLATLTVLAARMRGGAIAAGAPFGVGLAAATAIIAIARLVTP